MNSRRIVLMTAILAAMIAFGGLWNATWADEAPRTTERQFDFPSVGLAMGQTARMNVSNLGTEPIMVQFFIYDQRGLNLIPTDQRMVEPGQTEWVDLPTEGLLLPAIRQQIRGAIKVEGLKGRIPDKSIGGSLEVFDTRTGRANVLIGLLRFIYPTDQLPTDQLPTDQKTGGNLLPAV